MFLDNSVNWLEYYLVRCRYAYKNVKSGFRAK